VDLRASFRRLSEQYRRLRQARAAIVRLQQQMLLDIDLLEQALRLPPPPPALAGHAPPARFPGGRVVEIHYRQAPQDAELFAQTLLSLPVENWWEDWMRHADRLLDDPDLVDIVHQVMLKRWPKSRTRGRLSTPAEVVLRLLVLKHVRNWSYGVLARRAGPNRGFHHYWWAAGP
jgi:hypothetical protein